VDFVVGTAELEGDGAGHVSHRPEPDAVRAIAPGNRSRKSVYAVRGSFHRIVKRLIARVRELPFTMLQ